MNYQLAISLIVLYLTQVVVGELSGFKECQKRFGFSKKLKEQQKTIEEDVIEDLDGYIYKQEEQHNISTNVINQELSDFYHCLKDLSTCYELIDTKPHEKSQQVPYQQCFEKCYNPSQFQTQLMKELVEFSINCAKNNLNIEINFSQDYIEEEEIDDSESSSQFRKSQGSGKRQPWGVLIFGMVLSTLFVGWINIDRIKKKLSLKKHLADENSDLVEIYELNPDYLAHKRYDDNMRKSKSHHIDMLANIDSSYKSTICKTKNLIQKVDEQLNDEQKEEFRSISKNPISNMTENNNQNLQQQVASSTIVNISEVTTQHQSIDVLFKDIPSKQTPKKQMQSPDQSLLNENNGLLNDNCEDDSYLDDLYQKNDPFDL